MRNNELLQEIQDFFLHSPGANNEEVIEMVTQKIEELPKDTALDEIVIMLDDNGYIMDLEDYTKQVYTNTIELVCNVLDSYKDK